MEVERIGDHGSALIIRDFEDRCLPTALAQQWDAITGIRESTAASEPGPMTTTARPTALPMARPIADTTRTGAVPAGRSQSTWRWSSTLRAATRGHSTAGTTIPAAADTGRATDTGNYRP